LHSGGKGVYSIEVSCGREYWSIPVVGTVAFGLSAPLAGILLGMCQLALLVTALAALSYAAGLATKNEDAFAPLLNILLVPLLLLSGVLLPMSLAPGWLDLLSRLDPLRYVVDGMRATFLGHDDLLSRGLLAALALAALGVAIGTYTFVRESR
jgi:ABC-2 type transport system permease protein